MDAATGCRCRTTSTGPFGGKNVHIGRFRLEVHIRHMGVIWLCVPLELWQEMVGHESPYLFTQPEPARIVCGTGRVPPMLGDCCRRRIVSSVVVADVKRVQQAVICADIGHLPAIGPTPDEVAIA